MISRTSNRTLPEPPGRIDLGGWLSGLTDDAYRACAKGHQGAGTFRDAQGWGMVNVESIGGHLIVQHYRARRSEAAIVEMVSDASRIYLFHLVPVSGRVVWTLRVTPVDDRTSSLACKVDVILPKPLDLVARLTLLGQFLGRHVAEETAGFGRDIGGTR